METKAKKAEAFILSSVIILLFAMFAYPVLEGLDIREREVWFMIISIAVIQMAIVALIVVKRNNCGLAQKDFIIRGPCFLLALALAMVARFATLFLTGYYIGCPHEIYENSHRVSDFICTGVLDLAVFVMYVVPVRGHSE